jgi:hypothetical protein
LGHFNIKFLSLKERNIISIAKKYNIPIQILTNTLQKKQKPYYVAVIAPAVHYTMGGRNNSSTGVILLHGQPIKGFSRMGRIPLVSIVILC